MSKGPNARATGVPITTTTETVAVSGIVAPGTSANLPSPFLSGTANGPNFTVQGVVNFTEGTAGTAVTVRCKDQAGNQVGTSQLVTLAAGATQNIGFCFSDTSKSFDSSYQISLQQTAATADGTVNEIVAYVMSDG